MTQKVDVSVKKDFIKWFLNHYQLKRRECVWILNYIMQQDNLLENVHFVDDVSGLSRAMVMSTHCTEETPFRYYNKEGFIITDAEKAFHDMRLNKDEHFYIRINANKLNQNPQYWQVLEDNPETTAEIMNRENADEKVEDLINYVMKKFNVDNLRKKIDDALDSNNETAFLQYSKELNKLLGR